MDSHARLIVPWDVSGIKTEYRYLRLFLAARNMAGVDPWVFVTDGLNMFPKAATKAFQRGRGLQIVHIAEAHAHNLLNFNVHKKLNGEFKHCTNMTQRVQPRARQRLTCCWKTAARP